MWQRRFWEHTIRNENDFSNHFDYIYYNPVKHGLVRQVKERPWSSYFKYVRRGYYHAERGNDNACADIGNVGE